MNPDTGHIHGPDEIARMNQAKASALVPIPSRMLQRLRAMNIEQRKQWAAETKQREKNEAKRRRQANKSERQRKKRNRR